MPKPPPAKIYWRLQLMEDWINTPEVFQGITYL